MRPTGANRTQVVAAVSYVGRQQWWVCLHPSMEGLRCHWKKFLGQGVRVNIIVFVVVLKIRSKKSELFKTDFKKLISFFL